VFISPSVALAQKKLLDVKLGELPSWLGKRDFTPNGLIGGVRGGNLIFEINVVFLGGETILEKHL